MIFQLVPGGLGLFGCFTFDGVPLFWLVLFCENVCFWNVSHVWPSWSLFALPSVSFWFSPSCFLSVPNSIAGKPDLSIDPSRRIDAKNSTSYSFSAPRNWIVKGLLSFVPRASFFLCADRALIGGDVGRNGSRIRRRNGSHWRWILFFFSFHFLLRPPASPVRLCWRSVAGGAVEKTAPPSPWQRGAPAILIPDADFPARVGGARAGKCL